MAPRIPFYGDNERGIEDALYRAYLDEAEQSVYGPPKPAPQMAPSKNLGPISGRFLDDVSRGVLQGLQNVRPRGNAQGFAAGALGAFSSARQADVEGRGQQYAAQLKAQEEEQKGRLSERSNAARSLAQHRWQLQRDKQREELYRSRPEPAPAPPRERDPDLAYGTKLLNDEREARAAERKQKADEDEAVMEQYASDVASFRTKPTDIPKRDPRWNAEIANRINNKLLANGSKYSYQQLEQLWNNTRKWLDTSNAQRAVNTRKAAMTVLDHINQFEELTDKYREAYEKLPMLRKMELRVSNRGVYWAARNGLLGPEAATDAAGLEAVVNVLPTEYATVLSGGFAPQKEQLEEARQVFSAVLGPAGHKGRATAVRRLVKARVGNEQRNFSMIGGKDNPYLMEISKLEGWDLDTPIDGEKPKAAPAGGGKASKYGGSR